MRCRLLLVAVRESSKSLLAEEWACLEHRVSVYDSCEDYMARAQVYRALGDETRAASDEREAQQRKLAIDAQEEDTE